MAFDFIQGKSAASTLPNPYRSFVAREQIFLQGRSPLLLRFRGERIPPRCRMAIQFRLPIKDHLVGLSVKHYFELLVGNAFCLGHAITNSPFLTASTHLDLSLRKKRFSSRFRGKIGGRFDVRTILDCSGNTGSVALKIKTSPRPVSHQAFAPTILVNRSTRLSSVGMRSAPCILRIASAPADGSIPTAVT